MLPKTESVRLNRPAPRVTLAGVCLSACLWMTGGAAAGAPDAAGGEDAGLPTGPLELEIPIFAGGLGVSFYADTARLFEAARPGQVRIHLYGEPRMHEKMRIRVLDGSFPDATYLELPWAALARAGKVADLTPYLDGPNWEGDARWRDTFLPGVLDTWTIDGRTYGIPLEQSCWTLFYNKQLFREHGWEPPRTWNEFFALCGQIRAAGLAPVALPGVYLRYGDAFFRAAFYNLAGPDAWRAYNNLEPGWRTDPRFVRAAEVFQQVTRENLVPGWEGMTHTAAQLAFLQGRSAFVLSGSWFVNEMRLSIPAGFELGAMNFPVFEDGLGDPTAVQGGSGYFFAFAKDDARRVRLTVDFLRLMTSRERARAFARELDAPVAVRGVTRADFSPLMQDTAQMLETARASFSAPPNMLQPPGLSQTLVDARNALAHGLITPAEFGARLESAAAGARARRDSGAQEIAVRFPVSGTVFLVIMAGAFGWTAVGVARRLRHGPRGGGEVRAGGDEQPAVAAMWLGPLRGRLAVGFVGPAFLLFAGLVLVPGLASFAWSLTGWDGLNAREWVGLFNFKWLLFESDVFWRSLRNNLFLMIVPAAVVVPLALVFAALIHRGVAGAKVFRACFLFPNILGGVAASLIWLAAYDPANGFINSALTEAGQQLWNTTGDWWLSRWLLGFENHAWLASGGGGWLRPDRLYWALIPIYVWLMVGFNLVLYLAAMQGIDPQYYEAAELDGAGPVAQFFRITLPMIREVVVISVVFIVIGGLNTFEMVWLLTGQDPLGGSHVLATWMVSTMFQDFQIGRATAIAVVMFVIVLAGSAVTLLAMRREAVET
jgi:ABC-type sugar transport system permease subunit/ABC-type glycerol-3-phosphate transport system substrate-binding protein